MSGYLSLTFNYLNEVVEDVPSGGNGGIIKGNILTNVVSVTRGSFQNAFRFSYKLTFNNSSTRRVINMNICEGDCVSRSNTLNLLSD